MSKDKWIHKRHDQDFELPSQPNPNTLKLSLRPDSKDLSPPQQPGSSLTPLPQPDRQTIILSDKRNTVRDEMLKLIQRIFVVDGSEVAKLVVFAGVEHGNGCTSVCAHIGETLSMHGDAPVCLIDANPFAPGLYRYFGMRAGRPLSTINPDSQSVGDPASEVPGKKLWLMSCADGIAEIQYIMNVEKYRARLLDLCSQFRYILIDAPPVNASIQTLLFGKMADGMVLVLEANATRRVAALKAKETLESAGVKLLGTVLNKRTYPIPDLIYRNF